ncbi:hypothetical protein L3Q82_025842, partial [Scortum barcoo]
MEDGELPGCSARNPTPRPVTWKYLRWQELLPVHTHTHNRHAIAVTVTPGLSSTTRDKTESTEQLVLVRLFRGQRANTSWVGPALSLGRRLTNIYSGGVVERRGEERGGQGRGSKDFQRAPHFRLTQARIPQPMASECQAAQRSCCHGDGAPVCALSLRHPRSRKQHRVYVREEGSEEERRGEERKGEERREKGGGGEMRGRGGGGRREEK